MSAYSPSFVNLDRVEQLADRLRTGMAFVLRTLKWVVVLNVAVGWIVFWANVSRIHFSMGDVVTGIVTILAFVGPAVVVLLWSISARMGYDGVDVPSIGYSTS